MRLAEKTPRGTPPRTREVTALQGLSNPSPGKHGLNRWEGPADEPL